MAMKPDAENKKTAETLMFSTVVASGATRVRTEDLQIKSLLLCPIELPAHIGGYGGIRTPASPVNSQGALPTELHTHMARQAGIEPARPQSRPTRFPDGLVASYQYCRK